MYISKTHKVLFVHVPKTGGTAVQYLFKDMERIGQRHDGLWTLDDPEYYKDWFVFGFVRHPIKRLASLYRFEYMHALQWNGARFERKYGTRLMHKSHLASFDDFVKSDRHPWPIVQAEFFRCDLLKPVIYKYEKFLQAIEEISQRFGIRRAIPKRDKTHYIGDYQIQDWTDDDGKEHVKETCSEDFKRYGYKWTV